MAHAYTPGLKVKRCTIVTKTRRLPIQGEVLVAQGDKVKHDQIVARTYIPGDPQMINVANQLGIRVEDLHKYMIKHRGAQVKKDEVIAEKSSMFGHFKSLVKSPIDGTVELVSEITGQVALRALPMPLEIAAYIPGQVVHVMPNEGATIRTPAALIQGIFGIGGESYGELRMGVDSPVDVLTVEKIDSSCEGKILVGGSLVTLDALKKAVKSNVKGIIVGGIEDEDLIRFLNYEIGVAITGEEDIETTIVATEGFGKMRMAEKTFGLLKSFVGKGAAINGATQIRAGVIRPEIVIPLNEDEAKQLIENEEEEISGMTPGTHVRVIRDPFFGAIGRVVKLPIELRTVGTGSEVRVVEVELENGQRTIVPRANVEIIEE